MVQLVSKIAGTGIYLPKKTVTNHDLAKILDTSHDWIYERTGIVERHIAAPSEGEFPSEMALHASKMAIENANIEPNDIDFIFFASTTPDYKLPNSSSILQSKLNITSTPGCMDLAAACSGFVYALTLADSLIKTGQIKTALISTSEMLSRETDWTDRNTAILFGDGAASVILKAEDKKEGGSEILGSILAADSTGGEFFHQYLGGAVHPLDADNVNNPKRYMQMQGREMFKVAVRTLANNALKVLDQAKIPLEKVDWVIPHQANLRIIEATVKKIGLPLDKCIVNIDRYANTSATTIPLALHEAFMDKRIERGQILLFDTFGAGLTSGATVLRF